MKKEHKLLKILIFVLGFIVFITKVYAIDPNTPVSSDMTYGQCVAFQESSLATSGSGYFGHCIQATCPGGTWKISYFNSSNLVRCSNGNPQPYYQTMKNGCTAYQGTCTPTAQYKYCGMIVYYDCGRTLTGTPFTTTTKATTKAPTTTKATTTTKKPVTTIKTTKFPTTKTTNFTTISTSKVVEPPKPSSNTYLDVLQVEPGDLNFDKTIENYTIEVDTEGIYLTVVATPLDHTSQVKIENNEEIRVNTPVKITVTATDGSTRVYTINIKLKTTGLDNNARLLFVEIEGYENGLGFNPDVYSYDLRIGKETRLEMRVEPESEFAEYRIYGNADLKNKSQIKIIVTAQDGETEATYLINIHKSSANIVGVLIVLIILGVAGFVGFKLVRKLLEGKAEEGETSYEYE